MRCCVCNHPIFSSLSPGRCDVFYVVHVKTASTAAHTHSDPVELTEYASVNINELSTVEGLTPLYTFEFSVILI